MATVTEPTSTATDVPELHNGDRMTADEFHRAYARMPKEFKAELVGGVVYVASPLKIGHGTRHSDLNGLFWTYTGHTPGVECGDNTTVRLGAEGEPSPTCTCASCRSTAGNPELPPTITSAARRS